MSPRPAPSRTEWSADGLRFECTSCGACCTGPPGYVLFSKGEGRALARRLGVTHAEFVRRYTQQTSKGRSLGEVETEHGLDCVFLDRTSVPGKAICGVYEDRPTQCRTFPWWPENLRDRRAWERAARRCEGIGRGPVVTLQQIRVDREATPGG